MAQRETKQIEKPNRIRPWIGDPPPVRPPVVDDYRLVAHEQFDMLRGSIGGMVLIPFWLILFNTSIALAGGRYIDTVVITLTTMLAGVVIALVLVPLVHEAVHGLTVMLTGARPSFGIGPGFAYTTVREPLTKRAYLLVALAPLIVLTAVGIPLAAAWDAAAGYILFALVVNASGAVGDLWMAWRVAFLPGNARFVDLADGFAVYVPDTPAQPRP